MYESFPLIQSDIVSELLGSSSSARYPACVEKGLKNGSGLAYEFFES